MSNLKVNSKSSILEFKRKHNDLAGSVEGISLDITNIQYAIENCLGVIEIDSDEVELSFDELGISNEVLSGKYTLSCSYDGEYLQYIPVRYTDDIVIFIRFKEFNNSTDIISGYYIMVDGGTYSISSMYDGESSLTIPVVEPNPTLAGNEIVLEGLKVGETKYKVAGGTQLYLQSRAWSGRYVYFITTQGDDVTPATVDINKIIAFQQNLGDNKIILKWENHYSQYPTRDGITLTCIDTTNLQISTINLTAVSGSGSVTPL